MAGMTEHNSVQQPLVDELVRLGWSYFTGKSLDRQLEQVFIESEVVDTVANEVDLQECRQHGEQAGRSHGHR